MRYRGLGAILIAVFFAALTACDEANPTPVASPALLETGADIIATACPYCMVMITDGLKYKDRQEDVKNYDIAELVALSLGL